MHLRKSTLFLFASLMTAACAVGCSSASSDEDGPSEDELATKNLGSADFGLKDREIILTLDDGPGARTPELVDFLVREQVPAVFFMVGKNAQANQAAVNKVAAASAQVPGGLIIANHSMTHTTPLPQQGLSGAKAEILNADAILKNAIAKSQEHLGNSKSFFRPPYGAFTALGAARIAELNQTAAGKYVGPIFWNIGGELSGNYSADWACWGRNGVDIKRCTDGYVAEARARGKGILLVHDVHSKTIDMLTGSGFANGRSLIKELRSQGFKFVGLRAHDESVEEFANDQHQQQASTEVQIVAKVEIVDEGGTPTAKLSVEQQGAAKIVVLYDDATAGDEFAQPRFTTQKTLNPGQHFVTVVAYDAEGRVLKAEKSSFIMPAPVERGSYDHQASHCVNFDLLKAGNKFPLYHKKVTCGSEGSVQVPGLDGECYRFQAEITASRDPRLVGAGEWRADFDVSYAADARDKSKMTFIVEAESGVVESGKRHSWVIGTQQRPDVDMKFVSVDCPNRIWRGEMTYSNGAKEEVLFIAPPEENKGP